jgi:large subunit ribosomal protein L21
MYAVIRAGGKQYRVAPGDVIRIEKTPAESGNIEFTDVLAVSGESGQVAKPEGGAARVVGTVVEEGRADKILVFHFKRKKQYKKLRGHRQPFTAVRISEIAFDGQTFKAPALPKEQVKEKQAAEEQPKTGPRAQKSKKAEARKAAVPAKRAAGKSKGKTKSAAKKSAAKKSSKKKK